MKSQILVTIWKRLHIVQVLIYASGLLFVILWATPHSWAQENQRSGNADGVSVPAPCEGETISAGCSYLPIVMRFPTTWEQFIDTQNKTMDVVHIHNSEIFVGSRDEVDSGGGVYSTTECDLSKLLSPGNVKFRVLDLAFQDSFGLAGSFSEKVFYSPNVANASAWLPTASEMNPYVYAVTFTDYVDSETEEKISFTGTDDGVYSSTDKGITWVRISSDQNPTLVNAFTYDQPHQVLWIATYGNGVIKYDIAGNQFDSSVNDGLEDDARQVWDIVIEPTENMMYIATSAGVYARTGNDSWAKINGLNAVSEIRSLEIAYGFLYAGTKDHGIWRGSLTNLEQPWGQETGISTNYTVRDLQRDDSLCNGLMAATNDGLWVLR